MENCDGQPNISYAHKASDLQKIGYIPGINIILENDFEFDIDLDGMKFGHVSLLNVDRRVIAKFLEYEIDEIQILVEDIEIIPIEAKINTVFIQHSNVFDNIDDITHNAQNLAQNPNIKKLVCHYDIWGDFENNYTLSCYSGHSKYLCGIAKRNQQYLYNSRFNKVKPIIN
jgi:hypothetical protein